MPDTESLMRKIRALLSKTIETGCTIEEAESAALKARQLLDENNLTFVDMPEKEFKANVQRCDFPMDYERIPLWIQCLANDISSVFDCTCIRFERPSKFSFVGMEADVQTALFFFARMAMVLEAESHKQGSGKTFIQNFCIAASREIAKRLKHIKDISNRSLIIRKDEAITSFISAEIGEIKTGPKHKISRDDDAKERGAHFGRTTQLQDNL